MATLVTVRWRTPPPSSIDERLMVSDDGHARLDVLRPRSVRDTVGTYEGEVEEAEVRELTAAGPDVEVDLAVQDPRLAAVGIAADRVARSGFLAAGGGSVLCPSSGRGAAAPQALALGVLGGGSQPVEFELDLDACVVHFSAAGTRCHQLRFLNCRWDSPPLTPRGSAAYASARPLRLGSWAPSRCRWSLPTRPMSSVSRW